MDELLEYVDHMSTMNAKIAPDGSLLFVNKLAQKASGLSREELLRASFIDGPWWSFDPIVQRRVRAAFTKALSGETLRYPEKLFVFGRVLTIDFSLLPVFDETGRVKFVLAEARDISELSRSNADLAEFAFVASHDLQAPLRKIVAFAERVNAMTSPDAPAADCLQRLMRSAERMSRLVDDMLTLARLSGPQPARPLISLDEVAAEALGDLETVISACNGAVAMRPLPRVRADRSQMRRLIQNLVANGLKFAHPRRPPLVTLFSRGIRAGRYEICVEDNGLGVPPKLRPRLFKPLQRLHADGPRDGSGLGLAICQKIAACHGGALSYEPSKPHGSRFVLCLPATVEGKDETS